MSHHQRTHCPNCRMPYPLDGGSSCPHCGRNRDARSFEEIAASGQAFRQYLVYVWPLAGFLVFLYGASILLGQWKTASIRARSTVSVTAVTAPDLDSSNRAMREARRKADDARFWAAKARREAREVADIDMPPSFAFSSTAPAATGDSAFVDSSPSVAGARVVVTSGPPTPANPASAPTPNGPPSGGLSGKTL